LTLNATINDPACGDIRGAKVTFGFRNADGSVTPIPSAQNLPVGLVDPTIKSVGTATAIVQYNLGNLKVDTTNIAVIVNGNYSRNTPFDDTTITVAQPGQANTMITNSFINLLASPTGSGYLASGGVIAGDAGWLHVIANVSYAKGGKTLTNPQGGATLTLNTRNNFDGSVGLINRTYVIKTNAISGLTAPATGMLQFTAKANVTDVTNPLTPVALDGGATFQITTTNAPNSTTPAKVNVIVTSKSGKTWIVGGWDGVKSVDKPIVAGSLFGS
jgi:hypothetical protein